MRVWWVVVRVSQWHLCRENCCLKLNYTHSPSSTLVLSISGTALYHSRRTVAGMVLSRSRWTVSGTAMLYSKRTVGGIVLSRSSHTLSGIALSNSRLIVSGAALSHSKCTVYEPSFLLINWKGTFFIYVERQMFLFLLFKSGRGCNMYARNLLIL